MKRYAKIAARIRVPSGFAVAGLYVVFSRPTKGSFVAGVAAAFLGLALRGWAAGHLAKDEKLATTGPFAYTRNPLYLGSLVAGAGFALAGRVWWVAAVVGTYFLLVYLPVIGEEESHLRQLFPEYGEYAERVPRLLPRSDPAYSDAERFRWELYLRNREYQALAAYLVVAAVLAWKLLTS